MAYRDDIAALGAAHLWRFDGNSIDSIGGANGTESGMSSAPAVCEDAASSRRTDGTGDRSTIDTGVSPLNSETAVRYIGGWVRLSSVQLPPKSLFGQGATGQQFRLILWAGNAVMFEVVDNGSVYQAYGDRVLSPGRDFHILGFLNGNGDFGLYIDGVLQSITNPADRQYNAATWIPPTSFYDFGSPSSSTAVGNQPVLLNAPTNCDYNFWCMFDSPLSDAQVREELFEKGALPDVTITSQAGLDALANSARPDAPLCIRVDVAGSLTLTADNVTFDASASIHVQYTGTGTLTWINSNGSNASIGSTTNGGSINFVTPATLTVVELQPNTEVRFYESGTANELDGVENSGTSFSSSVQATTVDIVIISVDYQIKRVNAVDMSGGDVTVFAGQVFDRNYENP